MPRFDLTTITPKDEAGWSAIRAAFDPDPLADVALFPGDADVREHAAVYRELAREAIAATAALTTRLRQATATIAALRAELARLRQAERRAA